MNEIETLSLAQTREDRLLLVQVLIPCLRRLFTARSVHPRVLVCPGSHLTGAEDKFVPWDAGKLFLNSCRIAQISFSSRNMHYS